MPCPVCGDICRCSFAEYSDASPRWLPDADVRPPLAQSGQESVLSAPELGPSENSVPALTVEPTSSEPEQEDSPAWRSEIAARLNRYQARRKPRPPRYPSLQLRFETENSMRGADDHVSESSMFPQVMAPASNQALALNSFVERDADVAQVSSPGRDLLDTEFSDRLFGIVAETSQPVIAPPATGKIIEFPRSWTPDPEPLDELAEPVIDRPRILEAPEFVPPPPALGGITIEPARQPEIEKRPGIDTPLASATLSRRVFCAAADGTIIAIACIFFGFIFWKMTATQPPRFQLIAMAAGLAAIFWAAYQYLLLVYGASTPGLRLAGLKLVRFDGSPASRRLRRWRVLASFLSAASLGMGYLWVFLDEDALCWHDRITHTYLAPRVQRAEAEPRLPLS